MAILKAKAPAAPERLTREIIAFVQDLRAQDLFKAPGVAETIDWATALHELNAVALDPALVRDTLGVLLKYQDDIEKIGGERIGQMLADMRARAKN
jgi:hypothetical protein